MSLARAVPIALLLALTAPAMAHADATLSVTGTAPHKVLTFTVDDAVSHHTSATADNHLLIDDTGQMAVGASGCVTVDADTVDCGPTTDFERVLFVFGGGDDRLILYGNFPIDVSADGGAGDDKLSGGSGDDELVGGAGDDDLYDSAGADAFDGGDGDDLIAAVDSPPSPDSISCGPGLDALIVDDLDDLPDDCEALDPPSLDGPVGMTGSAMVGGGLTISVPPNVGGDAWAWIQWERCDATGYQCTDIPGANDETYVPVADDVGKTLRVLYMVENRLGDDVRESSPTRAVRAAPSPPAPRPPISRPPRPPTGLIRPPFLLIAPLAVTRKPLFVIRDGDPMVDTGRTVACPGVAASAPCRLKVSAVPTRGTAHVHGRPSILGESSVLVAGAARARVRVPLNVRAYRLLRARRKLTMLVTVTVTRPYSQRVRTTFEITIRLPKRH